MPELPEVQTVLNGLSPAMSGSVIEAVMVGNQKLRAAPPPDFISHVKGQRIVNLSRRGKYLVFILENGKAIIHHLGMSGSFRISDTGGDAKLHDHLSYILNTGKKIIYNDPRRFGMVYLTEGDGLNEHKAFINMGPDPFSDDFTPDYLYEALAKRQGPVKTVLLNQALIAGLGNIYVCEALYLAGIHPEKKAGKVTRKQATSLYKAILQVLESAIKSGGSSLRDHKGVDGTMGYFQHAFNVYGKKGQACGMCECDVSKTGGVKLIRQSGRSTFFCAQKQRI
mgnify:FL=1